MSEWKAQLESLNSLLRELKRNREQGGRLRFGRAMVVASAIADQFYCEKKVEMEYLHGEVATEAKSIGTLVKLQYRHVKRDLEKGTVPIHVHVEAEITKGK